MVDIFRESYRFDVCTARFAQAVGVPKVTTQKLCICGYSGIIAGYASEELLQRYDLIKLCRENQIRRESNGMDG